MKDAQIVALADVDANKRKGDISKVVGNIGNADNSQPLNMEGIKTYESGFDLINDPNVDVVDICCPTPDHAAYIVAALKAGKACLCGEAIRPQSRTGKRNRGSLQERQNIPELRHVRPRMARIPLYL